MSDETEFHIFPVDYLRSFCTEVFIHFGISAADAQQATDVLAKSDLRGIDSHGVARLHTYFEMLQLGRINPKPNIKIVREKIKSLAAGRMGYSTSQVGDLVAEAL